MPDRSKYLFSSGQIRAAVALGTVGMVATIVVLLLLATSRPSGKPVALDDSQFKQQVADATASITGYELLDENRARIDIAQAMALVAERGVQEPGFARAGATAPTPAPAGEEAGTETDTAADTAAGAGPAAEASLPDGAALYASVCVACHQATGQGIPGAFPPLADHAPALYAAAADLPLEIITFGMQGAITVNGMAYNGLMPAHTHMSDAELAAVANYVLTEWGNEDQLPSDYQPYTAEDATAVRAKALSMTDVHDARVAAGLD